MSFPFLPTTYNEISQKGWNSLDIILITGDAYIDHPSFGTALIGRYLESLGYTVGIIAQPDWTQDKDFLTLGQPRLFFGISAGNLDSMVANYTADKRPRKTDEYSEAGIPNQRPDRAVTVYSNCIRKLFPTVPIIIGGIEASLRRLSYYDFWSNNLRRSILWDSRADILVYGMAEKAIAEIARCLQNNSPIVNIKNTAIISNYLPNQEHLQLPSHEEIISDKQIYLKSVLDHEHECAKKQPATIVQSCQGKFVIVHPPDTLPATEWEQLFTLPFTRQAHPRYQKTIPGYRFVQNSVVTHRGCCGGCSFCTLTLHQGKFISSRSETSILKEIETIIQCDPNFKGVIEDVGGPSANMYGCSCDQPTGCSRLSCLIPKQCIHFQIDHEKQIRLLKKIRSLPGIRHVFIRSGIRYDMSLNCLPYLRELIQHHVGGQLSIAPEHISAEVLTLMQKPMLPIYEQFVDSFKKISHNCNKQQYVIPYFMSSHPGSTLKHMFDLATYMHTHHLRIEQVQNFTPIPMTLSAAMYYCEMNPFTMKPIHVPKGEERLIQRALLQPTLATNHKLVKKALTILGEKSNKLMY